MNFASRVEKIPPYLFVEISRKIARKRAEGIEVISFGIGDPDLETPTPVIEALKSTAGRSSQSPVSGIGGASGVSEGDCRLVSATVRHIPRSRK